jgi:hypothetical protein
MPVAFDGVVVTDRKFLSIEPSCGRGWPRRTDHLRQGVLAWKQIHHVIVLAPAIRRVCIIGMLAKNRPVPLALAVITMAVQVIYILIEMNALGSW